MIEAYPLHWPSGWKRLSSNVFGDRSRFKTSLAVSRDELMRELSLMNATEIVLSTNIPLRRDGLPYAGMAKPIDPGVAVYFTLNRNGSKKSMVFACDRWDRVGDNVQAIRLSVQAIRGIDRWGASDMLERAFTGFQSLPPPEESTQKKTWWEVLQVGSGWPSYEIRSNYHRLAKHYHPDSGVEPSHVKMAEINAAYEEYKRRKNGNNS